MLTRKSTMVDNIERKAKCKAKKIYMGDKECLHFPDGVKIYSALIENEGQERHQCINLWRKQLLLPKTKGGRGTQWKNAQRFERWKDNIIRRK